MADIFKNLRGVLGSIFKLGTNGVQIKSASGELQVRNSDDSAYARLKIAAPSADADAVTKYYADTLEKPTIVSRQADCSTALPSNTATRGYVVVTTAGSGAAIGDILYDDGSGSGTMTIVSAVEGRTLAITDALSGGTVTFETDSIYIWDADGSTWTKVGDIGSVTGALRIIDFTIDNSASQDSTSSIPANALVLEANLEITTAYSAGATIEIGNTTTSNLLQATTDNNPQTTAVYSKEQRTSIGASASVARVTVSGSPAAGAGIVTIKYTDPNN